MVELDAAGKAALGEEAELGDDEFVELDGSDAAGARAESYFFGFQLHVVGGRSGLAKPGSFSCKIGFLRWRQIRPGRVEFAKWDESCGCGCDP
jgi:hypothetical protein